MGSIVPAAARRPPVALWQKLTVSLPDDPAEREADRIAETVTRPEPATGQFGQTRYYRAADPHVIWTIAIGELRDFWVKAGDLVPVPRRKWRATPQAISGCAATLE